MDATTWLIRVSGYGTFEFQGTEAEAESMRAHKARWEGGAARKWRKDLKTEQDRVTAQIAAALDTTGRIPSRLVKRLRAARVVEATK